MFICCDKKSSNNEWQGYTLVVPCISVGNVGQLAADLLISTLYMSKAGYLYDDSIIPVIGNNPFATGDPSKVCELMTAAEVFKNVEHKMAVVQLRSSIVPGKKDQFLGQLDQWIESCGFCRVIILTSSFAHERTDRQLHGSQLRYVQSEEFGRTEASAFITERLQWQRLEERSVISTHKQIGGDSSHQDGPSTDMQQSQCNSLFIPGGGFAKQLYKNCVSSGMPVLILTRFCSEGDNMYDAVEMATMLNSFLSLIDLTSVKQQAEGHLSGWKIPSSWKLQYGSHFQQILFQ